MQTDGREGEQGNHKNSFPFIGRVSGHRQFYEEREKRGGSDGWRRGYFPRSLRGRFAVYCHDPPPLHFQVLPATQVEQEEL